jgi:mono/diheme cytochrome c family protein
LRRTLLLALPLAAALTGSACGLVVPRSEGEKLWRKECANCHGLDASGNTPRYMGDVWADLLDVLWRSGGDEYAIEGVIREGVFGKMPANDELSSEEIRLIVDYLYWLRGETR